MLSKRSQWLTYGCALLYGLLGLALFLAPEALSTQFAWNVSGFVTMTIGGWCIGTAWSALNSARNWHWQNNHAALSYLWLFGLSETLVLLTFSDKIHLEHPLTWLYLLALACNMLAAIFGVLDLIQRRPTIKNPDDPSLGAVLIGFTCLFIAVVSFLGIYGLSVPIGQIGTRGEIFPEIMSAFTLRSFGAFYLSLALGTIPLLFSRSLDAFVQYAIASYALIIFITLAAVFYVGLFDFQAHRFGLLYWSAYISVGIVLAIVLFIYRKQVKIW